MTGYIVLACCNFDDVVVGLYPGTLRGLTAAKRRAAQIELSPELRFKVAPKNRSQPDDTQFVCSRIVEATSSSRFRVVGEEMRKAGTP